MATQSPQSLPSFAQAFSGPSLSRLAEMNNALPPIHQQPRAAPLDRSRSAHSSPQPSSMGDHKHTARKRLHSESVVTDPADASGSDGRQSPRAVKVKQEADNDSLPPLSHASLSPQKQCDSVHTPPSLSSSPNPTKKRRMTISGINTDVRRPSVDSGISPVVMGFTIRGDDPNALEQVRSMINLKQQQQALIEQRRGSVAGTVPPAAPPDVNIVNIVPPPTDEQPPSSSKTTGTARAARRSPHLSSPCAPTPGARRSIAGPSSAGPLQVQQQQQQPQQPMSSSSRQPTPTPPAGAGAAPPSSSQRPTHIRPATDSPPTKSQLHPTGSSPNAPSHPNVLPPPPISFARRRASRVGGGVKAKPADIVISPRTLQEGNLQPIIQSAPPIPRGGHTQSLPGRFPGSAMALPSIPPVMAPGQSAKRITSGQVPPTPTRLSLARHSVAGATTGISGRSPPAASIPIASTLVPPTPASLHHPGYAGEKSAFLAPFEMFYDALSDSKQLKTWLGEQLQKSNSLVAQLQRQQEQMDDIVQSVVDKKMAAMRGEVYDLRVRVDELETALKHARSQGYSPNLSSKGKGKANGYHMASPIAPPVAPETYHFPPIEPHRRPEPVRRVSSPSSEQQNPSQVGSPVPFEVGKRLSVSAIRHDPRPDTQPISRSSVSHSISHNYASSQHSGSGGGKGGWSPRAAKMSLPTSSARSSLSHITASSTGGLPDRPTLVRRTSGQGSQGNRMHPPEKRRASRSPEADEEGRSERGPPAHLMEQRRASSGSVQHSRPRSPMDES